MSSLLQRWLKAAAQEVQEYIFLTGRAFAGFFTRPFYRHDVIEQFDLIGFGSLTVVLLAMLGLLAWLQFGVLGKRVHYR